MKTLYSLAVHGGAGLLATLSPVQQKKYRNGVTIALSAGARLLSKGASALDAVTQCVKIMEDDPIFNAGKGSVLDENGRVDMDAGIMEGKTLQAGSVAGVKNVRNPVTLARLVMEKSEHVMLISSGAESFGKLHSITFEPDEYFITEHRVKGLVEAKLKDRVVLDHDSVIATDGAASASPEKKFGTVGAVAFDHHGNLAAATSTGGITNKKFGRVGDSPIIGAGVYADNETCAVSSTGYGEKFIRTVIAKMIADFIYFKKLNAQEAADAGLKYLTEKAKGLGGFIVIDARGKIGCAFSTDGMIRAWVREGEDPCVLLWR